MAECKHLIANCRHLLRKPCGMEGHGMGHGKVELSQVVDVVNMYQWLTSSNIRPNTESLIMAAQEQDVNTLAIACDIYHAKRL